MARHAYDGWETEAATCSKCGWHGRLDDAGVELFRELMELSCPGCGEKLEIVLFPTLEESIAAAPRLSPLERECNAELARHIIRFENLCLKEPQELPDIDHAEIVLEWDHVGDDTVLKHGERVIWREPVVYDGYERFEEVAEILTRRYGKRLRDLVPTRGSQYYLLGDSTTADRRIDAVRERLRGEGKSAGE